MYRLILFCTICLMLPAIVPAPIFTLYDGEVTEKKLRDGSSTIAIVESMGRAMTPEYRAALEREAAAKERGEFHYDPALGTYSGGETPHRVRVLRLLKGDLPFPSFEPIDVDLASLRQQDLMGR